MFLFSEEKNCYVNMRTSIEFSRLTHLHVSEYCKLMPINETDFVLRLVTLLRIGENLFKKLSHQILFCVFTLISTRRSGHGRG